MMARHKTNVDELQEISELIEKIDKLDLENNDQLNSKIIFPYSSGKRPEPERWEDKGIQHKLP
ncbi:MAG: hypothetical protein MI865_07470 [Proteobacteria bacterium]|nr:hypothetical protein [Pseudomonadota bacterium]